MWLRSLLQRARKDRELDEEIRADLEIAAQERIRAGASPEEAAAAARRDFGNVTIAKEATRETWSGGWLDRLALDTRYSLRQMRKNPGFTAVVVSILALGIGANTAVFSLVDGVILKTLPVADPGELVSLESPSFSYPIYEQIRDRAEIFDGLFVWDIEDRHVEWDGELQASQVLVAGGEFYSTLGVKPAAGRLIRAEDDLPAGGLQGPVAVISHSCWIRRFHQAPDVIGKAIRVDRVLFTIVGVTPREFFGVAVGMAPEVTIPVTMVPKLDPRDSDILRRPSNAWLHIMGRLKPGLSIQQADSAFQVLWPRVLEATTNPNMPRDRRARYLSRATALIPAASGHSRVRRQFAEPLWLLMSLVALLLLVACATVANLLLAKASARRREVAVRIALGASRFRVMRQLLTEGLLLAGLGGIFGIVLARWAAGVLVGLLSTSHNPIELALNPDWRVLAFTAAVALATAILFTVVPAFRATKIDPGPALKETSRALAGGRSGWRLGKSLVVSQVAVSMLLLIGAVLFTRSLNLILSAEAGFERNNLLLLSPDAVAAGYEGPRLIRFYGELLRRLNGIPGVRSVSLSKVPPVSNEQGSWTQSVSVEGAPPQPEERTYTYFNAISPGYFETIGTPLIRGRDFGPHDNESGPRTVIVNELLARAYFPSRDPIGRRISIGRDASRQNLEIVGIVKAAKYQFLQEPDRRIAYLPYLQLPEFIGGSDMVAEIRTTAQANRISGSLLREVRAMDRTIPVVIETMADRIRESLVKERVIAAIAGFLGIVALLLASAGLCGLLAYTVSRRTNEIGIRIAIGAKRSSVVWMVLSESLKLAALGIALGLAASLALGKWVASLLYGLEPADAAVLTIASAVMISVAIAAASIPARRAARVDPVVALRTE